jgi:hypothetical protein
MAKRHLPITRRGITLTNYRELTRK